MASPRVLVIDSDPSSLGLLTHGLHRFGLTIDGAGDMEHALKLLRAQRPDVVVSEVHDESGLQVLERLRQSPETKDIPVLFLAKGAWARRRAQVRELGAQELVAKPAFVQDIAVLTWLYAGRSAQEDWFEGTFGEPSCAALLRGLLAGGRSGTLRLEPTSATVRFRDGAVIDATLGALRGERALLRILTLGTGSYELTFELVPTAATMQFELSDLTTRGLAHVRQWEKLEQELLPLDQVLTVDFESLSSHAADLPRGLFGLVRLFDGKRTIADVMADSTLDDLTAGQAIAKLHSLRVFDQSPRPGWDGNTPAIPRPAPANSEIGASTLPPFALAPDQSATFSYPLTDVEREFYESAVLETGHEIDRADPARSAGVLRKLGWVTVALLVMASGVLFWRSTPGAAPSGVDSPAQISAVAPAPVAVAPFPAVVPAPATAPVKPSAPTRSETARKFDALMSAGAVAYDRHHMKDALTAFDAASALAPEDPTAELARGSTLYDLGKLDLAAAALTHAATLDPKNGRTELLLGAISQEKGKKLAAREHYQKYLAIDPSGEHVEEVKALLGNL